MAKDRPISRQQMPQHRNPAADTEAPNSLIADADTKTKEEEAAEDSTSVDPDTPIDDHHLGSGVRPGQAESDAAAAMHAPIGTPNLQGLPDEQSLSLDDNPAARLGAGQLSDADVLAGLLPDSPTNGDGTQSSAGDGSGGGAGHSPTSSGGLGSSLGLGPQQPNPFGPGESGGAAHAGKPGSDIGAVADGIHGRVVYDTIDDNVSLTTYEDGTVERLVQRDDGSGFLATFLADGSKTIDDYDENGDLKASHIWDESGQGSILYPDGTIVVDEQIQDPFSNSLTSVHSVLNPDGTYTTTTELIEGQGQDPDQDGGTGRGAEIGRALHSDLRGASFVDHSGDDVDFGQGDTGQAEIVGGPVTDPKGALLGGDGRVDFEVGGMRDDSAAPPDGAPPHGGDAINTGDDHVDAPGGGSGLEDNALGDDTPEIEEDPDDDAESVTFRPPAFADDIAIEGRDPDLAIHDFEPDEP